MTRCGRCSVLEGIVACRCIRLSTIWFAMRRTLCKHCQPCYEGHVNGSSCAAHGKRCQKYAAIGISRRAAPRPPKDATVVSVPVARAVGNAERITQQDNTAHSHKLTGCGPNRRKKSQRPRRSFSFHVYWYLLQVAPMLQPDRCYTRSLHELHHIGVAHRDLSLENFLVADNASLRLTDFEAWRDDLLYTVTQRSLWWRQSLLLSLWRAFCLTIILSKASRQRCAASWMAKSCLLRC